jgi:methionine synthase I (cobalamin-dependent)
VLGIQRRYAEAGRTIITNTFGGSRIMLNRHGHAGDVAVATGDCDQIGCLLTIRGCP